MQSIEEKLTEQYLIRMDRVVNGHVKDWIGLEELARAVYCFDKDREYDDQSITFSLIDFEFHGGLDCYLQQLIDTMRRLTKATVRYGHWPENEIIKWHTHRGMGLNYDRDSAFFKAAYHLMHNWRIPAGESQWHKTNEDFTFFSREFLVEMLKDMMAKRIAQVVPAPAARSTVAPVAVPPLQPAPAQPEAVDDATTVDEEPKQPADETLKIGLTTQEIASAFDGIQFHERNWPKNLSSAKWVDDASIRIIRGQRGGAPSTFNPLLLAQWICGRYKNKKQENLNKLNKRFNSKDSLRPWREGWNQYFQQFSDD